MVLKIRGDFQRPNGLRVSGERRAEGDERVRCTRVLDGRLKMPLSGSSYSSESQTGNRRTETRKRSYCNSRLYPERDDIAGQPAAR